MDENDKPDNVVPIIKPTPGYVPRTTPEERAAARAALIEIEPGVWKATAPNKSREYLLQIGEISHMKRLARVARGESPSGRGRLKPITEKEIRERALDKAADLFADARVSAVNLLVGQMHHKDPGIAQKAAIKVLEYTDGKPTQTIISDNVNTTKVVYETAALPAETFTPGFGSEDADVA